MKNQINWRLVSITIIASLGGFLFGYDTGFIGGATTLDTFQADFGITAENKAAISGNVVSALQAGCFFGVIGMSFITDRIGRRLSLAACGIVFNIGGILQTASSGILGVFYAGRVISGLGVGSASMLTPTFLSEMSPKEIRGQLTMFFGFCLFLGIAISYWVDYACKMTLSGSKQWLVPVGLQLIPGSALAFGMLFLRESPRWLVKKNRRQEAFEVLTYIRELNTSEQDIREEFAEICDSVEMETLQTQGAKFKEIFLKGNRGRFILAIAIMICQQLTGTLSFTYYAPVFFQAVGLHGNATGLFATGVYGIVKCVSTMAFLLFGIERVGRKGSLLVGAFIMGSAMLIVAVVYATHPPDTTGTAVSPASYAMIVMIYIFCVGYSISWGPVPWSYCAEIFPNRLREYGVTIASATQWAFNYMFSKVIPFGINSLGWRIFLMFSIFNYAIIVFTWFFVKETKGLSLEEMDELFGSAAAIDIEQSKKHAEHIVDELNVDDDAQDLDQKNAQITHDEVANDKA